MPKHVEHLKIFLASPGDVQTERDEARRVIEEINRTIGPAKNIYLDVIGWETDAYPGYGGDAQSLVNNQIADMSTYDLFLGIMWNRFGQPTPRANSGTEEEFNRAADEFERTGQPEIMLYFSQAAANLSTLEQLEQKGKVIEFKARVRNNGLTWDYAGPQDFSSLLQRHLSQWVFNRTHETPKPPATLSVQTNVEQTSQNVVSGTTDDAWLLLNETFYIAAAVKAAADGTVTLKIQPRDSEEVANLRSLSPQPYNRSGTVPYAYQNDGGLAEVKDVSMDSEGGQSIFTVQLRLANTLGGNILEAGVNGFTADKIAELRARLLLLNEFPVEQDQSSSGSIMHFVSGFQGSVKVEKGIFPDFWKHMQGQPTLFVPLARLMAIYYLKSSNTIEHVLEFSLGPVSGNILPVRFRGKRKQVYTNSAAQIIEVVGNCPLA